MPVKKKMHNSVFHCPADARMSSTICPHDSPHAHELVRNLACTNARELARDCPREKTTMQHNLRYVAQLCLHVKKLLSTLLACGCLCVWKDCNFSCERRANTHPHIHHVSPRLTTIIHKFPHNIGRLSDMKPVATKPYSLLHSHMDNFNPLLWT